MGRQHYDSLEGQAVVNGVMIKSPNACVIAVRRSNGEIRLRTNQCFEFSQHFSLLPFRGMITLVEAIVNAVMGLNYSLRAACDEEMKSERLYLTVIIGLFFGLSLFVFVPHKTAEALNHWFNFGMNLDGQQFHFVDGVIKVLVLILYIKLIGLLPDIRRMFQYHGAKHKVIATFEAEEELTVENAKKHRIHLPRCKTSLLIFLLLISTIFFPAIFTTSSLAQGLPYIVKHIFVVMLKLIFILFIAGTSYEVIRLTQRYQDNIICRWVSFPGMLLQRLTTDEPDDDQLEVALSSLKTVLVLENHLKTKKEKVLTVDERDIPSLAALEEVKSSRKDFLEI